MKRDDRGQRQWERRLSPEEVALRWEAGTCKGCVHILKSPFGGPEVACKKRKRKAAMCVEDTRRCEIYSDGTNDEKAG